MNDPVASVVVVAGAKGALDLMSSSNRTVAFATPTPVVLSSTRPGKATGVPLKLETQPSGDGFAGVVSHATVTMIVAMNAPAHERLGLTTTSLSFPCPLRQLRR